MFKDCDKPQRHSPLCQHGVAVALVAFALLAALSISPTTRALEWFKSIEHEAPPAAEHKASAPPQVMPPPEPPPADGVTIRRVEPAKFPSAQPSDEAPSSLLGERREPVRTQPLDAPPPSAFHRRIADTPPPQPVGDYREGEDYHLLDNPQPSSIRQIEVVEFFWYGCPHCALFEPHLRRWAARQQSDVRFHEVPAVWRSEMEAHARAYYTAKALGRLDDIHGALFNALALQQQPLHSQSTLGDFFAKAGVAREEFDRAWTSFSVSRSPAKAKQSMRAHGIGATPTMVIAGTYQVRAERDMEKMLQVVEYLIARERYERYVKGTELRDRARQSAEEDARRRATP